MRLCAWQFHFGGFEVPFSSGCLGKQYQSELQAESIICLPFSLR